MPKEIKKNDVELESAKKFNKLMAGDEVNLKELQIKLEKIRSYIRKTEARVNANETALSKLREKRQDVESKRLEVSVIKKGNLTKKI